VPQRRADPHLFDVRRRGACPPKPRCLTCGELRACPPKPRCFTCGEGG